MVQAASLVNWPLSVGISIVIVLIVIDLLCERKRTTNKLDIL